MARSILRSHILWFSTMLLAVGGASSCILPEKCIFIYKTGHRWTGNVAGTAVKIKFPDASLINGKFSECKPDAEHAILAAGDVNDPQYIALRNELLADAALDCAQQASPKEYKQDTVRCDPFSDEYTLTVTVEPDGECTLYSETVLVKGSRDECIGPEESLETSSSSDGAVDSATIPTTSAGDDGNDTASSGDDTTAADEAAEILAFEPIGDLDAANGDIVSTIIERSTILVRNLSRLYADEPGVSRERRFSRVHDRAPSDPPGFGQFLSLVREAMEADVVGITLQRDGQLRHHIFSRQ